MVSVIICTYNRAHLLPSLLEVLSGQQAPAGHGVEIVVVDNNSTDDTRGAVARAARTCRYPVRVAWEPEQGLARARNRGIAEARGAWLVFLDDDAVPRPGWLHNLIRGARELGCGAVGGPVVPSWPDGTPRWIAKSGPYLRPRLFSSYELGPINLHLRPTDRLPFGGNMALHGELSRDLLYFDVRLGKVKSNGQGSEETDLFNRLCDAGVPIGYVADARVLHPVDPKRFDVGVAMRFMYEAGRSAQLASPPAGGRRRRRRDERTAARVLLSRLRAIGGRAARCGPARVSEALYWLLCGAASAWGEFRARVAAGARREYADGPTVLAALGSEGQPA